MKVILGVVAVVGLGACASSSSSSSSGEGGDNVKWFNEQMKAAEAKAAREEGKVKQAGDDGR